MAAVAGGSSDCCIGVSASEVFELFETAGIVSIAEVVSFSSSTPIVDELVKTVTSSETDASTIPFSFRPDKLREINKDATIKAKRIRRTLKSIGKKVRSFLLRCIFLLPFI